MKTPIPVYGGNIHFFTDFDKFNAHHKKANKDEVGEGRYDLMEVSLDFLRKRYS